MLLLLIKILPQINKNNLTKTVLFFFNRVQRQRRDFRNLALIVASAQTSINQSINPLWNKCDTIKSTKSQHF